MGGVSHICCRVAMCRHLTYAQSTAPGGNSKFSCRILIGMIMLMLMSFSLLLCIDRATHSRGQRIELPRELRLTVSMTNINQMSSGLSDTSHASGQEGCKEQKSCTICDLRARTAYKCTHSCLVGQHLHSCLVGQHLHLGRSPADAGLWATNAAHKGRPATATHATHEGQPRKFTWSVYHYQALQMQGHHQAIQLGWCSRHHALRPFNAAVNLPPWPR
jgi:hypothetical protein